MKRNWFCLTVLGIFVLGLPGITRAQTSNLAGNWKLTTFVSGSEYGVMSIDASGVTQCTEAIVHELTGEDLHFDLIQQGRLQVGEEGSVIYAAGGIASASENSAYRVTVEAAGAGLVSPASNMIAGVWTENQVYTKLIVPLEVFSATPVPFLLIKEGSIPELPGLIVQEAAGNWNVTLNGSTLEIGWTGGVTLNTNGTLIGFLIDKRGPIDRTIPSVGFFTLSETGEFAFEFSATVDIPNLGGKTVTISGSGTIGEDRKTIQGTWTLTIAPATDGTSGKIRSTPFVLDIQADATYSGDFTMTKESVTPPAEPAPIPSELSIQIASSAFDADREEWLVIGDAQDNTQLPFYRNVDGNPGGYIEAVDDVSGGTWYWFAPVKFLGDKSAAYGGLLTYDIRQSDPTEQYDEADVILQGAAGLRLSYQFHKSPGVKWTSYMVSLTEGGWNVVGAYRNATKAEMIAVLSTLRELWIRGEYRNGDDRGGLDNVMMIGVSESTPIGDWTIY
ncbi:MAG: laminin B domain-containing protein [Candidatus Omnitrophota bacterium]